MSNIFTFLTVSLPFSRDVSTAISNILQTTTARWRHGSHSAQTYHSGVCPPRPRPVWLFGTSSRGAHTRVIHLRRMTTVSPSSGIMAIGEPRFDCDLEVIDLRLDLT